MKIFQQPGRLIGQFTLAMAVASLGACGFAPAGFDRAGHPMTQGGHADESAYSLIASAVRDPADADSVLALGEFIELWKTRGYQSEMTFTSPAGGTIYQVRMADPESGSYGFGYFDQILPAPGYKIRKIDRHRREGVGTPLVAIRENRHEQAIERHYPPEAITRPLTAVMEAGSTRGGVCDVEIRLLCPLVNDQVKAGGKTRPLAADFSAPWAVILSRAGDLDRSRFLDMITSKPKRDPELYLMEPYDPEKEPLIMIHGLLSTPLAWSGVSNDLWADEKIRRRYQIWHYQYNTSAPALYSARLLRARLREVRSLLDPDGNDPAMRKTTLLAHSMGGLIAKASVVEPGDVFWDAAFKVPNEDLRLSADDRDALDEAFEWKPDPTVHRIIYVAVPHRGSDFADNLVGRLGRWLTSSPVTFQDFYTRISAANPGVFTPAYVELGSGKLNSVGSLSPRQPTLKILADLPHAHPVKVHSIIGNRGKPGKPEDSSDGVVPYTSSHLDIAVSELVVPAGHGAYHDPAAMEEIKRVLKLK